MTQIFPRVRDSNQNWCLQAQVWRHMPVMSALVSQRQENYSKCKFSSAYPALPGSLFGNLERSKVSSVVQMHYGKEHLEEKHLTSSNLSVETENHTPKPLFPHIQAQPPLGAHKTKPQTMTQPLNVLSISWTLLFGRALELYYRFASD